MLILVTELPARHGKFHARLEDGTELCKSTRQPLLDGTRELLKRGVDPQTRLVMRHEGSPVDALTATVGAAAKLTVDEGNARRTSVAGSRTRWSPRGRRPIRRRSGHLCV
jgi:hypothetical protein